ncbi:hypothetical protein QZM92_26275 [Burkholderia multivorans]|nr:hypothetical protein [Burkholderia multivorans]MDN7998063.1 hypothetical protein [Burkholderia multivorans]
MDVVSEGKKVANSEDQRIHEFCLKWASWHRSRRLFAPPVPRSLLARLQPEASGEVPDANLSASASYFNLALLAMPEGRSKQAFYLYYLHNIRPVKLLADEFEVSNRAFYKMLGAFRKDAYRAYERMLCGV